MICRVRGRLVGVGDEAAIVEAGCLCYEVLVPRATADDLTRLTGEDVTFFTLEYLDGNPAVGHLVPRLVGFLSQAERDFFGELTKVKGMGPRTALRAMSLPASQIAAAIENGDARTLATLPQVGKATAAHMIAQLRGKVGRFTTPEAMPRPASELTEAQRLAVDILVRWGDRRADAARWVGEAVEAEPGLTEPEAIVRTAYRLKTLAGR